MWKIILYDKSYSHIYNVTTGTIITTFLKSFIGRATYIGKIHILFHSLIVHNIFLRERMFSLKLTEHHLSKLSKIYQTLMPCMFTLCNHATFMNNIRYLKLYKSWTNLRLSKKQPHFNKRIVVPLLFLSDIGALWITTLLDCWRIDQFIKLYVYNFTIKVKWVSITKISDEKLYQIYVYK